MIYSTVIGNLGRDAELRSAPDGKPVLNFSVATRGKKKEDTIWVRCAVWGTRAEKIREYLTKGTRVTAIGRMTTREYEGKTNLELDVQEVEWVSREKRERDPSADW